MMAKSMLLALSIASAFSANVAFGQDAVKAEDQYVVLSYFKVDPQNQAAYEELLRTTSKKIYTEMMNQPGSNMWGWNISRILFNGTDEDAPTHVAAAIYNGPPPGTDNPAADAVIKKITGMERAEYMKKLAGLREALGTELVRGISWTAGSSPEGTFRVVSYLKAEPRKATAFRDANRSVWQPVMAAAVRDGKLLAWSTWGYVFPRGENTPYDLLTAASYTDLPSAVRGYTASAADFLKVHPSASFVSAVDELRDSRKVSRTVVSLIIASSSKNVTRQ